MPAAGVSEGNVEGEPDRQPGRPRPTPPPHVATVHAIEASEAKREEHRAWDAGMLARMPEPIIVGSVTIPEADLSWRFSRSSGPGGQSVNTTDSRVELVFDLANSTAFSPTLHTRAMTRLAERLVDGAVVVVASENRSQLRNRDAARERLAELLAEATAPPPRPRRPTKPSKAAQARRMDEKTKRGQTKRLRRDVED
jgi:ribosome-associated protein